MFYYLIDLHYSQTLFRSVFLIFSVLLPYRFTLFSNSVNQIFKAVQVLLPYRFTLFSNAHITRLHSHSVLLPYRFTLFSNTSVFAHKKTPVLLPYRFTLFSNIPLDMTFKIRFYYLIDLHYSQTYMYLCYHF